MPVFPMTAKIPDVPADTPGDDFPGADPDLPRKRRKRRSAELRNSLRLGLLLTGLVGINIYVFFFNRGTAPREVLKPAATAMSAEAEKTEILRESAGSAARRATTRGKAPVAMAGSMAASTMAAPAARVPAAAGRAPAAHARPERPAAAPAPFAMPF